HVREVGHVALEGAHRARAGGDFDHFDRTLYFDLQRTVGRVLGSRGEDRLAGHRRGVVALFRALFRALGIGRVIGLGSVVIAIATARKADRLGDFERVVLGTELVGDDADRAGRLKAV